MLVGRRCMLNDCGCCFQQRESPKKCIWVSDGVGGGIFCMIPSDQGLGFLFVAESGRWINVIVVLEVVDQRGYGSDCVLPYHCQFHTAVTRWSEVTIVQRGCYTFNFELIVTVSLSNKRKVPITPYAEL